MFTKSIISFYNHKGLISMSPHRIPFQIYTKSIMICVLAKNIKLILPWLVSLTIYIALCSTASVKYSPFSLIGFLWQLLSEIAKQHGNSKRETGMQTEKGSMPFTTSLRKSPNIAC